MKYTTDEALRETLRRADALRRRRSRRTMAALSAASALLIFALCGVGSLLIPRYGADLEESAYGAFLLPGEAGGYVLAGVAAFAVGVLVTMLCLRHRSGGDHSPGRGEGRAGGESPAVKRPEEMRAADADPLGAAGQASKENKENDAEGEIR